MTCTDDYEIPVEFTNPATSLQDLNKLDDEAIKEIFRREANVTSDAELEEIAKKKLVKFFTVVMNLSETQAKQMIAELSSQCNLIQYAVQSFRQSANLTLPLRIEDMPFEVIPVLEAMLARKGKVLYPATATAVLNKKNASNPLYLELIDTLLNMIESDELLNPRIRKNANLIIKSQSCRNC